MNIIQVPPSFPTNNNSNYSSNYQIPVVRPIGYGPVPELAIGNNFNGSNQMQNNYPLVPNGVYMNNGYTFPMQPLQQIQPTNPLIPYNNQYPNNQLVQKQIQQILFQSSSCLGIRDIYFFDFL